ncbi:glycerophosphodiester phosphodiesterase family protein [Propylenella binzhouense]|uniref:Glycerophosphodiester phosphodiesterase n=1 Tax=Propylenella binzhouense TaxID=2555902 RepID=A0A964T2D1_9HYPH|nr:glycerophosphodiester phosphodiesterase family protein [Propylenella binzhouense]MYZ46667.1 glycerophosphodiester phosphodiesterase [Propylenella binzhouense]
MRRSRLRWLTGRPIAHRGFHDIGAGRPENTIAAFRAAIARDYAIECDVHPAADGVPVVFHDDTLDRLTRESGPVRDRSAAELAAITILRTQETIPTLDRLLACVGGRVPLLVELKSVPGRDAGFAAAVAERLKHYEGPVAVMSFDPGLIADLRGAAPLLPRGLTAEGDYRKALSHLATILREHVHFVSYSLEDLPTAAPLLARRMLGLPLISWTVRSPAERERAERWTDQITFEGFAA